MQIFPLFFVSLNFSNRYDLEYLAQLMQALIQLSQQWIAVFAEWLAVPEDRMCALANAAPIVPFLTFMPLMILVFSSLDKIFSGLISFFIMRSGLTC